MRKILMTLLIVTNLIIPVFSSAQENLEECTIGIATGKATVDGRPLLWKNRDTVALNNEINYFTDGRFKYLAIVTVGFPENAWAGVNEMGFCIINSVSNDLKGPVSRDALKNGAIMKKALQSCVTVDDFEKLLTSTNIQGRNTGANFGVIDAFGGAIIFETGFHNFTKFDANNREVAPEGYIVRANFAMTGGGSGGKIRYDRAEQLWQQAVTHQQLDYRLILRKMSRDLADEHGKPYKIPFKGNNEKSPIGTFNTNTCINRYLTASVSLFHGVRQNENPSLTTFWAILGEPVFSVAVPCWVISESVAAELDGEMTSPLCDRVLQVKNANYFNFGRRQTFIKTKNLKQIQNITFPVEDQIFEATDQKLAHWRMNYPRSMEVADFHKIQAKKALKAIEDVVEKFDINTEKLQVGVYADYGASDVCVKETMAALKIDSQIYAITLNGADIARDALLDLDVLIIPGGSGSREGVSLGDLGRQKVKQFVENGGGYVGICAGAYIGSDHPSYDWRLSMADAHVIDREHYARGGALVSVNLSGKGKEMFPELNERSGFFCYYNNGPLLQTGDNTELEDYESLATFVSDVHHANNAPSGKMPGTAFLLSARRKEGRAILCSGHPESTPGLRWMVPRMARWVADRELIAYAPHFVNADEFEKEIMIDDSFKKIESKLLQSFKKNDKSSKINSMKELKKMGSREFQRWLPDLLRDSDPGVRKLAVEMILDLDCTMAVDDLDVAILNEDNIEIKKKMEDVYRILKIE